MSKFRRHSIEEMRQRSKMRKQRKKYMRKSVECDDHSMNEKKVNEGTVSVENEWTKEEKGDYCIEEDKINGNSHK